MLYAKDIFLLVPVLLNWTSIFNQKKKTCEIRLKVENMLEYEAFVSNDRLACTT
jgi:hypothetical protein